LHAISGIWIHPRTMASQTLLLPSKVMHETYVRTIYGRDHRSAKPCLVLQFSPNFTMQKEDSLSHQNVGKCMEY
jgi:hypothetical protein